MKYKIRCNSRIGLLQFFPIRNDYERDNKGNIIIFSNKQKANDYLKKNFLFNSWLGYWCKVEKENGNGK